MLAAAEVPKGSFYFYFKNKEDFGLQVVDCFDGMYRAMADPIVNDRQTPALVRMERLLEEARSGGDIAPALDVTRTAYFIVSSWHGALIQMKIVRGLEPLENHKHFVMGALLQPDR